MRRGTDLGVRSERCDSFIEGWYLSYFSPEHARSLPLAGPQKHLNSHGDNLGNVIRFMEREHPKRFQAILDRIAGKSRWAEAIAPHIDPERNQYASFQYFRDKLRELAGR